MFMKSVSVDSPGTVYVIVTVVAVLSAGTRKGAHVIPNAFCCVGPIVIVFWDT